MIVFEKYHQVSGLETTYPPRLNFLEVEKHILTAFERFDQMTIVEIARLPNVNSLKVNQKANDTLLLVAISSVSDILVRRSNN